VDVASDSLDSALPIPWKGFNRKYVGVKLATTVCMTILTVLYHVSACAPRNFFEPPEPTDDYGDGSLGNGHEESMTEVNDFSHDTATTLNFAFSGAKCLPLPQSLRNDHHIIKKLRHNRTMSDPAQFYEIS
jgi:hypothetical protein